MRGVARIFAFYYLALRGQLLRRRKFLFFTEGYIMSKGHTNTIDIFTRFCSIYLALVKLLSVNYFSHYECHTVYVRSYCASSLTVIAFYSELCFSIECINDVLLQIALLL